MVDGLEEIKAFVENYEKEKEKKKRKKTLKIVIRQAISQYISFILDRKTKEKEEEKEQEMLYRRIKNILRYIEEEQGAEVDITENDTAKIQE